MKNQYWQGVLSGVTITSLGLVVLLVGSGFQAANLKIGVVDSINVTEAVFKAKNLNEELAAFKTQRVNVVEFLDRYRLIKRSEAEKFVALSLKANKTEVEKNELEKIKTATMDAKKKFDDLQLKASPTPEELKQLEDFRNLQANSTDYLRQLVQDSQNEFSMKENQLSASVRESYTGILKDVAKKGGYSIIFERNLAPFGTNDLTDDVVKAASALKK